VKPGLEVTDAEAHVVACSEVGVVVALRWHLNGTGEVHRRYQALKLRDGLVYDMQDYREERAARRAVRLRS
jgi:hypothetical protein